MAQAIVMRCPSVQWISTEEWSVYMEFKSEIIVQGGCVEL